LTNNGIIYNTLDGENSNVTISYSGIDDMANLASIHNHPSHGFNSPSDKDIDNMLHNPNEKYCIVLSENKIWILKNKYHNIDLREENNRSLCMDCINMVNDIGDAFDNNKIDKPDDLKSLETINNKMDKDLTSILGNYGYDSWIINI